nr:hypothetical protein [Tanacetum cinerariifolium]
MNAKLVWLREKYNYGSKTHMGGSSSQTREICDVYLTEKELHQLHLDEEALRVILKEEAMAEKEHEEKIRQKQADGGSSSQQHTHQPMSLISSYPTIEESAEEHDIGDEYLTERYRTEKEQQQLLLDEETL